MRRSYLKTSLALCLIVLFGFISSLLIIYSNNMQSPSYQSQHAVRLAGNTVKVDETSNQKIGILVKVKEENMEEASKIIRSKGGSSRENRIGDVIAANFPQDQMESLAKEDVVEVILPNRQVQAFSIDVSETNAQIFWSSGYTGKGVKIAVLDTGINSDKVIAAKDFTGSGTVDDENSHGTRIAEIIEAMAPDVKFINAKVLDKNGLGSEASVIAGINYAVEQNADIISLSLGGLFDDLNSPLVNAVEEAIEKGIVVVAAAGNCKDSCSSFTGVATPGNSPNVITVGAEGYSAEKDYGDYFKPDIFAPENANSLSGSSASTPFVTGAAALILNKYSINPFQVKSLIKNNADSGTLNLDFLTEEYDEEKIEFETAYETEISEEKDIVAFSGATSSAGDWHIYQIQQPWTDYRHYEAEYMAVEMYNETFGFLYVYGWGNVYGFDGETINYKIEKSVSDTSKHSYCDMRDIAVINATAVYAACLDRIKRLNSTYANWIADDLPEHANTTYCIGLWCDPEGWPTGGYDFAAIDFNGTTGFAGGSNLSGDGFMLKKVGAGNWLEETDSFLPIKDVKFVNSTLAFAVGSTLSGATVDQKIYKWEAGTWSEAYTGSPDGELNALEIINNTFAVAVGNNGTVMEWNGALWSLEAVGLTLNSLYDVDFYNETLGYAVGSDSTILKYEGSWNLHSSGESFISQQYCIPNDNPDSYCFDMSYAENVIEYNTTFRDVNIISPKVGYLFGVGMAKGISTYIWDRIEFRIEPGAPYLNVPKLSLAEDTTLTIDLKGYSNGETFVLDGADTIKCSLTGNNLTILPVVGFIGLMTCKITANITSLYATQAIPIEVYPAGPVSDLMIESSDIQIVKATDPEDINVTVHNIGTSSANDVNVTLIEIKDNKFLQQKNSTPLIILNGTSETVTFSMDIQRGSNLIAVVDYDNSIVEYSESNNRAETKYKELDVYIDFAIESGFAEKIRSYLQNEFKNYNIVNDIAEAEAVINITYNAGDKQKGCKLGTVYYNGKAVSDIHAGLIFTKRIDGKTVTSICAARIEGLVNAVKRLNKEDITKNKETFFDRDDLGAIAIRDFFNNNAVNPSGVERALNGPLEVSEDYVSTTDGTLLRLKHYKPIISQSFVDYLFAIEPLDYNWLEPVIMARGLWSNLYDWEETAKEIAIGMEDGYFTDKIKYAPRDVWLIELTGGPNTECDSCVDYTYDDVVDKHWPALVGGVLELTGKGQAAYVGFSNGARVALDALSNYATINKNPAGYLSNGTSFDLPSPTHPITTYIGVGVPGAFNGTTYVLELIRKSMHQINNELISQNIHHVTIPDLIIRGIFGIDQKISNNEKSKISFNLWQKYSEFINSTTDKQPGLGVSLDRTLIIAGTALKTHDGIVLVDDVDSIYSNINVSGGAGNKKVLMHIWSTHGGPKLFRLPENKATKRAIKEFLNKDQLSHKIEKEES